MREIRTSLAHPAYRSSINSDPDTASVVGFENNNSHHFNRDSYNVAISHIIPL